MTDVHKRVYQILLENAQRNSPNKGAYERQPSISTLSKNGSGMCGGLNESGNDVYYSADPTYPEELENVLTPKNEQRKQLKNNKGGFSVGDLFPALKLFGLGAGCCENCALANISPDKAQKMMEFQNNGEMQGNKEAQELTSMLANKMRNPYQEQEELGTDQLASGGANFFSRLGKELKNDWNDAGKVVGGKYCTGFGKNNDGCGGKKGGRKQPNVAKLQTGLSEYREKYNALRERGLTPKQARDYIKRVKAQGGNFWDTIGSIAKTVLPFVPLIL
jgi:hypothetical protein